MKKLFLNYFSSIIISTALSLILLDFFILPFLSNQKDEIYVPDVKGMNVNDIGLMLEDFSVNFFYVDFIDGYKVDEIISTSPRAYTKVKEGREIKVTVIADKKDIVIEELVNKSLRNANMFLDRNNIVLDTAIYEYSESIERNYIVSQYPKHGSIVNDDSKITLIVSLGNPPDYYIVPDLINLSFNAARKKISESGLLLGEIYYERVDTLLNNTIIQQNQPAYKRLSMPIEINLTISKDK